MFDFLKPKRTAALTPAEACERASRGEIQLVDVREANEWAQMHIAGAIHAPLSTLVQNVDALPKAKPVVFYCLSGKRSRSAVEICRKLGLPHETDIAGGISAWRAAGLPVKS